jgi:2-methylcitrate dehydratase PrpD
VQAAQDRPRGDPENPLSADELTDKFRQLAAYGGLDRTRTDQALEWLQGLGSTQPPSMADLRAAACQ